MQARFITKDMHAFLDYPVAALLIGAPFLLGLGASHPAALWLSVGTGVAALLLTLLTDHRTGLLPVVPYRVHVMVDGLVGAVFLVAPFALGFTDLDAWFYWANAAAVLLVVTLQEPLGRPPRSARAG